MGRTEKAENIRIEFIDTLKSQGAVVEDMSSLAFVYDDGIFKPIFTRWASLGREIFLIKQVGFVNVHVRSEAPGFWGITKQVLRDFKAIKKELKIPCWFILLVSQNNTSEINGYILNDIFSSPTIEPPSEQKEAYKINERNLDPKMLITTTENVAKRLLTLGLQKSTHRKTKIIRRKKT